MSSSMNTMASLARSGRGEAKEAELSRLYMTQRRGLWLQQQACLEALAPYVPKRRARKLRRAAQIAITQSIANGDFLCDRPLAARAANELVVDVRFREMDEIVAAAFRAAKKRLFRRSTGHGGSYAK
ncbi:hypothetical protein ATN89_12305 [Comamonas thiooxydans]|nr:hypothetical protein ATN89_12305 [Comamonas thiooxydans]